MLISDNESGNKMATDPKFLSLALSLPMPAAAADATLEGYVQVRGKLPAEVLRVAGRVVASVAPEEQVLLVTSSADDDRPHALARELAEGLAVLSRQRVVLVDGDPERNPLATALAVGASPGLAELVSGSADLREAIIKLPGQPFHFLPAGQPDRPFNAPGVAAVLANLRAQYRFVVISSGRLLRSPDALLLGQQSDGAVIAVAARRRRRHEVLALQSEIGRLKARLLGAVVVS